MTTDENANDDGAAGATELRKLMIYPLVAHGELPEELCAEALDMIVTSLEKFPNNHEVCHLQHTRATPC